jgi:tRNA threonylcarbamoyladenosine biosynthesis protein TsaB
MSGVDKLLLIETSSAVGTVALAVGDRVAETRIETPREQTERILASIDELLEEAALDLRDLDALVFGRGPGSFTGLRVAAAVVQGLGLATGKPIVSVSSLAALAARALAAHAAAERVLCCVDARMGEVYFGTFVRAASAELSRTVQSGAQSGTVQSGAQSGAAQSGPQSGTASFGATSTARDAAADMARSDACGLVVAETDEAIGPPAAVTRATPPYLAVGDGCAAHAAALAPLLAGASHIDSSLLPRARDLLAGAREEIRQGRLQSLESALPVYLRGADAWRRS